MNWRDSYIEKYFGFLLEKGFSGPFVYMNKKEIITDFIKKDLIINVTYDGLYLVRVIKINDFDQDFESGKKRSSDLHLGEFDSFDLSVLDAKKKIYSSISCNDIYGKQLCYNAELLTIYPEILNGDLKKLKKRYQLLRKLRFRV